MAIKQGSRADEAGQDTRRGLHMWGYAGLVVTILVTIGILELVR